MEHDVVEVGRVEEPVAANGRVLRGDRLERATGEVGGEDDVDDVLRAEASLRRDGVDERDGTLEGELVDDPDLLEQLAVERGEEVLAGS